MNKQSDNRLALSVVATLTAGIALVYILIAYPKLIFAVAGVSVIFLICAYMLTQNIVAFVNMRNKSLNVQIKSGMDDLSNQIEGMSSAQAQLGKATYLYTRQAAENVASLKGNYADSQEALFKNLSVLANAQNKSTKLLIKYDQNNTTKLISTLKDVRNHLTETMSQGFDQMQQPNNADVVAMLESIVEYLKSQPANMDQSLGMQINNVAHELQNISSNIARVQSAPMQGAMPGMMPSQGMNMAQPMYQEMPAGQPQDTYTAPTPAPEPMFEAPAMEEAIEPVNETPIMEDMVSEPVSEPAMEAAAMDAVMEEAPAVEELIAEEPPVESVMEEPIPVEPIPEPVAEVPTPVETVAEAPAPVETVAETPAPEPVKVEPVSDDPNKQLSPDEIANLFASVEATEPAAAEPGPADEASAAEASEEPFTPTFTVVGKSEDAAESVNETPAPEPVAEAPAPEPAAPAPVSDDPNKQLSADEIAALFAAADPAPKKEPAPEPVAPATVSDDPNKQLSADEIAALFAAADPAPKKEEPVAEEPAPAPEPVKVEPVSDDPNKQLSPDEIAALFASIG